MKDFKRLLKYLEPHRLTFGAACLAMFFTALFETAIGALLVPLLDLFSESTKDSSTLFYLQKLVPRDPWFEAWIRISLLLFVFTICKGIFSYLSVFLMTKIGQSVVLEIRQELYTHLLSQSADFFEKHRTNFLVSRIVVSCAAIEHAVTANLRDVLREGFMLISFLGAAFYYSWRLMFGALIIGPIVGFLTMKFSKSLQNLAEVSIEGNKRLTDTVHETLSNQTIVKAYLAEDREKHRFSKVAELIARANLRSGKIAALSPPTLEIIGVIAIVILFYFGLREINIGNMEVSQFFTFLFFLFRSYDPMRKISRQHNEISKAFAAAKDIWNILDQSHPMPEKPKAVALSELKDKITFKDVCFSYQNGGKQVLKDVSLDIPKGHMIALVGESGGGKSSLIKLVQRLHDPTRGAIFWDGIDLRDVKLSSLKLQIALVTQETILFNDTIRYNISYGKFDATTEQIKEAASVAFADEFIEELPEKYETIVGERGSFLSGGQRQRVAIARAVLVNAPLIILDEATSALDAESEKLVRKAMENLMKNHTSIVIAHRFSTIRRADKIIVLEKGRIIETGNHKQLLANNGIYKKHYKLQLETSEQL